MLFKPCVLLSTASAANLKSSLNIQIKNLQEIYSSILPPPSPLRMSHCLLLKGNQSKAARHGTFKVLQGPMSDHYSHFFFYLHIYSYKSEVSANCPKGVKMLFRYFISLICIPSTCPHSKRVHISIILNINAIAEYEECTVQH